MNSIAEKQKDLVTSYLKKEPKTLADLMDAVACNYLRMVGKKNTWQIDIKYHFASGNMMLTIHCKPGNENKVRVYNAITKLSQIWRVTESKVVSFGSGYYFNTKLIYTGWPELIETIAEQQTIQSLLGKVDFERKYYVPKKEHSTRRR